jgi:hypothetical protein
MSKLPTLTTAGWIEDLVSVSTSLMDYFLVSEESQTQFYPGEVASLPFLVQQYGSDPDALVSRGRDVLQRYFSRYFEMASVEITSDEQSDSPGRYNINIDVTVVREGKTHRLGRLIELGDSKIINVNDPYSV